MKGIDDLFSGLESFGDKMFEKNYILYGCIVAVLILIFYLWGKYRG